jgi:hypothetical protein
MSSPYLLHNRSIWKSIEDNRDEKIGKGGWVLIKRIVYINDQGGSLIR